MADTAQYWIDKAKDQFQRKRFEEAIVSANKATDIDIEAVNAWWFSALSKEALQDYEGAYVDLLEVTLSAPDFADGWARMGAVLQFLIEADGEDEWESPQAFFERAIECDSHNVSALTVLAEIYSINDEELEAEKEIEVLTNLESANGWLTSNQLNRLGILHYNFKSFFDAIKYWSRTLEFSTNQSSMFNLGLVYNHDEYR